MKRKVLFSFLWRGSFIIMLVLAACAGPTPTPSPTPTSRPTITPSPTATPLPTLTPLPTATPLPTPTPTPTVPPQPFVQNQNFGLLCEQNEEIVSQLQTTPFYIQEQVILSGPTREVSSTLNNLAIRGVTLTPVILCTLNIPNPGSMPDPNPTGTPFSKAPTREGSNSSYPFMDPANSKKPMVEGNSLAMNLYQFDSRQNSLSQILNETRQLQIERVPSAAPSQRVYADPNYLIGHMANSACGNPFSVEGSPFSVEGSPFSVEGSPNGGMGLNADAKGFWSQWAFTKVGLKPPDNRQFDETGYGVRVGVFDTSPYTSTPGGPPITITNMDITPALTLTVTYPIQFSNLSATTPVTAPVDVKDHGLFVSSLIHAFAPQSQIDLYRVLDDKGCGDLYRLNIAILDFLSSDWGSQGLRQPAVINLSLGVRKPRQLPADPQAHAAAEAAISQMGQAVQRAYAVAQADPSTESLDTVIQLAHQAGIVIVAAGGNDSVITNPPQPNMPLSMELPADFPYVIGVSASTKTVDNNAACYSNGGDVAAPGGDATESVDSSGNPICVSQAATCPASDSTSPNTPGSCEYGVMGLSTLSTTGYAYWVGTSFATPMVSGLAALVYQRLGVPGQTASRVKTKVSTIPNHQYGLGLINVPDALLGP